jgi:hypothetical protein
LAFLAPVIGAIGSTLAAGGIGAFALKLGGSLLLSAASSALMRRPEAAAQTIQGRTVSVREAAAARRIIYGRARVGGTIIYMDERTAPGSAVPNNELHLVIVLAATRVLQIGAIYLDGELAINADGTPAARFAGNIGAERHLGGDSPAGALPFLQAASEGQWTAAHRLAGCAAIFLSLNYKPEVYPGGIPNVTADVFGCDEVFDPRSGLTGYSENPALCLAHYMAHPRFGLGAATGAFDGVAEAELIAAANVCDEIVAKVGGGTEPRYSMNGVVDTAAAPQDIIEGMLTAMAGDVVPIGGQFHIYAGAYRAPVMALTDDDVVDGGFRLTTRVSRADNFNAVRGKFVSPENDWAVDDFPAYTSAIYLAEDRGEQVWADIVLPYTISASMAQRLAKIHLEKQRRQFTVTCSTKLSAWRVAPMETVTLTRSRWGFSAKPFEVRAMSLEIGDSIVPSFTLRETSPLIYDWNTSEAQVYAAAPRTNLPSAFVLPQPGPPSVSEELYVTAQGDGVKARATLIWQPSPSPYVATYEVIARYQGGPWQFLGETPDTTFQQDDIGPGVWEWGVRGKTRLGVLSAYATTTREIFGLGAPPAALSSVTLQSVGGLAVLEWALHPDLDVRIGGQIVIRHSTAGSPAWANSVSMKTVPGSTALAVMPLKPGSYILRALDAGGNYGPETVIPASGAQALNFTSLSALQEDATFTGAKTGTLLDAGALRLDVSGDVDAVANFDTITSVDGLGGVIPSGSYVFAAGMNFGAVTRCRLRSVIDLTVLALLDNVDTRPQSVDEWANFDGIDGGEVDCVVEVRTTQTNPGGSPVWTAWARVDSSEISAWGVQARAILTTRDAGYSPAVTTLRLLAEGVA